MNDLAENLNWYDLYRPNYPTALTAGSPERVGKSVINGEERTYLRGYTMSEYANYAKHLKVTATDKEPVLGDVVSDYMNREDVREAFNIPSDVQMWEMCSDTLVYEV